MFGPEDIGWAERSEPHRNPLHGGTRSARPTLRLFPAPERTSPFLHPSGAIGRLIDHSWTKPTAVAASSHSTTPREGAVESADRPSVPASSVGMPSQQRPPWH